MLAYPLTEKAFRTMVAELAERRATTEIRRAEGLLEQELPPG